MPTITGLALDLTQRIVNVRWGTNAFLYSGADGMFASEDGETWRAAPSSVAATSLAWIDDVWVGCNGATIWRSEDGAKTWETASGPKIKDVVAIRPISEVAEEDEEEQSGIFCGWVDSVEDASENPSEQIYVSIDGGQSWELVFSVPTIIPVTGDIDGSEFGSSLSGCGSKLFFSTIRKNTLYHHGDGMIYVSSDGTSFSSLMQFGPGDVTLPAEHDKYPRRGYTAMGVGFDAKTKRYAVVGHETDNPAFGVVTSKAIYSSDIGAGGEGSALEFKTYPQTVSESAFTAGGNGMFVTGIWTATHPVVGATRPVPGNFRAQFFEGGDGVTELFALDDIFDDSNLQYQIGPFVSLDKIFACVAFRNGPASLGGVWIAKDGATSFAQTHGGVGLDTDPRGRRAGLGTGAINW